MASKTEQRKIQIIADGSSVNSSLQEMQKASKLLYQEMSKLPANSEEFAKKSEQFQNVKKRLDETKGAAMGAQKSLNDMANEALQMSPIGGIINGITGAMGKAKVGVNLVTTSFKTLRGAIMATGIGLLVVGLGLLINYLTSTQDGIDKVNRVLTPMRVIFEKLQGVVQNLGGNLFKGLGELLNGNLKDGFNTLKDGAKQAGDELGKAFTDGIKQGGELAEMNIKIEQTEIELTKSRALLNEKYQEAKEIAQDQSRSEAERVKAARDAQAAQNELLNQEQSFMDLKIDRLKLEQSFNDTSREGYQELADLEAQRTMFEAQAAKKRSSAKALENTISKEIHSEQMKRLDEQRKKEEDNQKRLEKLRDEYLKYTIEAEAAVQDMLIAVMEDGTGKKIAKLDLELERELAKQEERRIKLLENETLTEEERQAVRDQFAQLAELKRQEHRQQLDQIREEEKEKDLQKQLKAFDESQEREALLFETSMMNAVNAEMQKKDALLQIQREYAAEKLALLEASGEGESLQALKLKKTIAQIDKDIADNRIAEAQRAEDFKIQLQQMGFEAAKGFMQLGLELMGEEARNRKTLATAMKAVQIGQVVMMGIKEVQAIWSGAATLGPVAGPIVGALQTAIAVSRAGLAVNKIRTTQYATGGATGSGRVIDMMLGGDGTWRMPGGRGTRNVGSFASGGHVGTASFGVIGEAGSEWVGPNWMLRSPKYANIFGYLEAERRRATPFAAGGPTSSGAPQLPQNSSASQDLQQFMAMIEQFGEMREVMEDIRDLLEAWPQQLRVVNDPRDILKGVRVLNEIEADSRINR
jgi:hypothetical protein